MKSHAESYNIAVVVSRFNAEITERLHDGAVARLHELGFRSDQIKIVWVPGAIEIPITAQRLAKTKKYDAILCYGAVILGETKHFDYVCQQVSYGCQRVALKYDIPVIFGILTTSTEAQAFDRAGGKKGHLGRSLVDSAYDLLHTLREI